MNLLKQFTPNFKPDPKPEKVLKEKRVKIKPLSDKMAKENKAYLTLRKIFLNGKYCNVTGCTKMSKDIHHQKGRIGKLLCDIDYWIPVCREHHFKIENNPEWAYKMGYSLKRNEKQ